jgi:hypothetical protein
LKKQKDTQAITSPTSIEEEGISKENQKSLPGLKTKKSVKFASSRGCDDDDGWQSQEIKKLEARITELLVINEDLHQKLAKKRYDEVYKENEILKMEIKNMYAIQEENKDLREDLDRLKSMTYEDRMKETMEENKRLRRRNGELIIKVTDL